MSFPSVKENLTENRTQELPSWLAPSFFEAKTSLFDKISRVANILIFAAAPVAIYALATGGAGIVAYASYLALGLTARKIVSVAIGYQVYPIALTGLIGLLPFLGKKILAGISEGAIESLGQNIEGWDNLIVKKIDLYKSGVRYSAFLVGAPDTIENGHWMIEAFGNGESWEMMLQECLPHNLKNKCNTLVINGPSVVQSEGWPTRYQMGAAFEAGLQYLEQQAGAKRIIMRGRSLGGGMMAEAILQHDFTEAVKNDVRYLMISDRSFGYLSKTAGDLISRMVEPIFYWAGMELDGVSAAKKIAKLGIPQIVIQHQSEDVGSIDLGTDGVIPDRVSLIRELENNRDSLEEAGCDIDSICSPFIHHNLSLSNAVSTRVQEKIDKFLLV